LAGEAAAQLFHSLWFAGIGVVGAGLKAIVAARYSVVITCPAGSGKEDLFEWKTVGTRTAATAATPNSDSKVLRLVPGFGSLAFALPPPPDAGGGP
jgi:hypothetical protein